MKIKLFTLFVILTFTFICFSLDISSLEIDMKTNYSQQETLIAKIPGEFLTPILKENVYFYKRHIRTPMDFEISKLENSYYIYAILPSISDDFSLVITGVQYKDLGKISTEDIVKNFTISNETADFNIRPGFVKTSNFFSINLQNLKYENTEVTIKTDKSESSSGFFSSIFGSASSEENKIVLSSGETKKLTFNTENFNEITLKVIEIVSEKTNYTLLVYVVPDLPESSSGDSETKKSDSSDSGQIVLEGNNTARETDKLPSVNQQSNAQTCKEINGVLCGENYECSGELRYAKDGKCCLGECIKIENNSTIYKFLGWFLIIVLMFLVYWFFVRKYFVKKF